jgi:hypothetical protein
MKSNVIAAAILAAGLVLAAFLFSGRYYVLVLEEGTAIRVDRWTGEMRHCRTLKDFGDFVCTAVQHP